MDALDAMLVLDDVEVLAMVLDEVLEDDLVDVVEELAE